MDFRNDPLSNKIRENGEELWNWIDAGAYFYVCGDATYMAPDVEKALIDLIRIYGNLSDADAIAYLKTLKEGHRYPRDVY